MARSSATGVAVSLFVEPTSSKSSEECRDEYWSLASRNPAISKETIAPIEAPGLPGMSYTITATHEGEQVAAQNSNTYIFYDGACIDVHVSVFPARDSGPSTLRTVSSSITVVASK